jgi:hypothetical protein
MYTTVFLIGLFTGAGWWSGHKIMDTITAPIKQPETKEENKR